MSTTLLAFSDVHVPYHDPKATELFCKVVEYVKPDILICLGDLLDCTMFSTYPPTYGLRETLYEHDVQTAYGLLQRLQQWSKRCVFIEGNHEYRIARWAARTTEGRGAASMLMPSRCLNPDRSMTYIPYGNISGKYPHWRINQRIVAVHGWTYSRHATKNYLNMSQGQSIIHGHTHTADAAMIQHIWKGYQIEARSAGCLCKRIPLYGTGKPVEWVHAFILGFLGRRSDTLYTVPILGDRCILPDGSEIHVQKSS